MWCSLAGLPAHRKRIPRHGGPGTSSRFSFALWFAGDAIWSFLVLDIGRNPSSSVGDLLYFAGYGLLIAGVVAFPIRRVTRSERVWFWLESAIILVGLIVELPLLVERFGPVVILFPSLFGLAIARQILTLRENTRLQIEQSTQQSERYFQALVEYSSDMITVVDRDLTCRFQSLSSRDVLGFPPEKVVGTNVLEWVDPAHRASVHEGFESVLNRLERVVKLE